jgi:hypothetical protein
VVRQRRGFAYDYHAVHGDNVHGVVHDVTPSCASGCYYNAGTVVTLKATPASGHTFSAWSGSISTTANPTTVKMTAPETVHASFH